MSHIDNPPSSDTLLDYFLPQSSIGPIGNTRKRPISAMDQFFTRTKESQICITIHWIDNNWQMLKYNLTTTILALTTDNHSVMIVCGRNISNELSTKFNDSLFSHYRCGANILNLSVQHGLQVYDEVIVKVRNFMNKVRRSNLLTEDLRRIFEAQNISYLGSQIDIEVR
ncbi:6991_t:CDS:2 [Funneliformis geosporum]|nr:6991_t:CDS:2 [Funneliformis geosporum]